MHKKIKKTFSNKIQFPDSKVGNYLLRGLKIERKNQVWQTDITYIPMKKGFVYMMAIIDVKTRYILHWSVSNTMDYMIVEVNSK